MILAASRRWFPRFAAARLRLSTPCVVCELNSVATGCPICRDCERDFFREDVARCVVCAIRLPASTSAMSCASCLRHPPHFDATMALGDYAPPVDGMVVALKAGGRLALAGVFGALLARRARRLDVEGALIMPVPLAFERHSERGFNQALEIARRAARDLDLQLDAEALLRVRHAAPQHVLALAERRRNVRGAFTVRADVRSRHAIVIDDVMTTGSTLDEIGSVLKKAGAARVTNLVVARTP
jgi:ComF family protein